MDPQQIADMMPDDQPNPADYKQTHDPMGRQFTKPSNGGPIPNKTNVTVGYASAGFNIVQILNNEDEDELYLSDDIDITDAIDKVKKVLQTLGPYQKYNSDQAYFDHYETFVTDRPFTEVAEAIATELEEFTESW